MNDMEQVAKVEIKNVNNIFGIVKWLRKEMNMNLKEAKLEVRSGEIDFHGDVDKAYEFFSYLDKFHNIEVRLFIDFTFKRTGYIGPNAF